MTETTSPTLDMVLAEIAAWAVGARHEQALAHCNELAAIYPDAVCILRARARANELAGNFTLAGEDYARALDILPADSQLMIGLARCQAKSEQAREAAVIAQQALAYEPHDADALQIAAELEEGPVARGLIAVARSWFRAGLVNRALSEMTRVNQAEPDRVDLQVVLAEMLWRNGLKVTTVELCQSILDEQPECLNAHVILSALWAQMGNHDIAQVHARNVDRLDPDHRATREWLGDASPFAIADVPAQPAQKPVDTPAQRPHDLLRQAQDDRVVSEQDVDGERDRSAWVDELIAAAGPVTGPNVAGAQQVIGEEDGAQPADIPPLEWTPAADNVQAEDEPAWLSTLKQQPVQTDLPDSGDDFGQELQAEPSNLPGDEPRVVSVTHWSPGKPDATKQASAVAPPAPAGPESRLRTAAIEPAPVEPTAAASDLLPASAPAETELNVTQKSPDQPDAARARVAGDQPLVPPDGAAPSGRKRIIRRRSDKVRPAEVDKLALARQAIEAGQYDQALEHYGSLIAANTQLDTVLADLDTITHVHPEIKGFHKLLGNLYERKGEVNAALMAYHRALDKN